MTIKDNIDDPVTDSRHVQRSRVLSAVRPLVSLAGLFSGQGAVPVIAKLVMAGALVLLTGGEIASHWCNYPSVFHPDLGRVGEPGSTFRWREEGNGTGIWTTNGIRRGSWPGTVRDCILIVGDSYTEALHVDDQEYFPHLLENKLRAVNCDRPVLALGRSGRSLADYVAEADTFKRLYSPGWVVVQLGDDDFGNDAWRTDKPKGFAHFTWSDSHTLGVNYCRPVDSGICGWTSDHARYFLPLVLFLKERQSTLSAYLKDNDHPWFHAVAAKPQHGPPELAGYPLSAEMKMLAGAYSNRVTILYVPRFDPENPAAVCNNERLLSQAAKDARIHFASLREEFGSIAATGHAPFGFSDTRFNWGHWNRYGHRAAANLLFRECPELTNAVH
jgi:hypothetical protein